MPADTPHRHGDPARSELPSGLPSDAVIADLADVFGLLGDPGRMRILLALLGGPLRVNELSDRSGLSPSATSHALRLLRSHRVVEAHREGRTAEYALADEHVRDFLELGLAHVGHTVLVHTVATPDATPEACDPPAHP